MKEQIDIFGDTVRIKPKIVKQKRNWEDRFQRWSTNNMLMDSTYHYGKCGYGALCVKCEQCGRKFIDGVLQKGGAE